VTVKPAKAKMEMEKMTRAIRISINVKPAVFLKTFIIMVRFPISSDPSNI
jgi:hypothetical protein